MRQSRRGICLCTGLARPARSIGGCKADAFIAEAGIPTGAKTVFLMTTRYLGCLSAVVTRLKLMRIFFAGELERTEIRADRSGVAVFSDPQEWLGRPAVGERIDGGGPSGRGARPKFGGRRHNRAEKGAEILPQCVVRSTSLLSVATTRQPRAADSGTLACWAEFVPTDGDAPQLGLKGTAKFYGEETFLGFISFA